MADSSSSKSDSAELAEELSESEVRFLLRHTPLTLEDLTPESFHRVKVIADANLQSEIARILSMALNADEVKELLSASGQSVELKDLYSMGLGEDGEELFAEWQFVNGRILPRLSELLEALEALSEDPVYGPISVRSLMTTGNSELEGLSPAIWLGTGGELKPVLALIAERAWI